LTTTPKPPLKIQSKGASVITTSPVAPPIKSKVPNPGNQSGMVIGVGAGRPTYASQSEPRSEQGMGTGNPVKPVQISAVRGTNIPKLKPPLPMKNASIPVLVVPSLDDVVADARYLYIKKGVSEKVKKRREHRAQLRQRIADVAARGEKLSFRPAGGEKRAVSSKKAPYTVVSAGTVEGTNRQIPTVDTARAASQEHARLGAEKKLVQVQEKASLIKPRLTRVAVEAGIGRQKQKVSRERIKEKGEKAALPSIVKQEKEKVRTAEASAESAHWGRKQKQLSAAKKRFAVEQGIRSLGEKISAAEGKQKELAAPTGGQAQAPSTKVKSVFRSGHPGLAGQVQGMAAAGVQSGSTVGTMGTAASYAARYGHGWTAASPTSQSSVAGAAERKQLGKSILQNKPSKRLPAKKKKIKKRRSVQPGAVRSYQQGRVTMIKVTEGGKTVYKYKPKALGGRKSKLLAASLSENTPQCVLLKSYGDLPAKWDQRARRDMGKLHEDTIGVATPTPMPDVEQIISEQKLADMERAYGQSINNTDYDGYIEEANREARVVREIDIPERDNTIRSNLMSLYREGAFAR